MMSTLRKTLSRLLLSLGALLAALILLVAGIITYDTVFPARRVSDLANRTFPGPQGVTLQAYYTRPEGAGPFPAVMMVHEFFGLNEDILKKADLLAAQGYAVLAVDAYRGQTTPLVLRAVWLVLSAPRERIDADLDAAFNYLVQQPEIDPARIGAVGFCFGGTQVMHQAARNIKIAATVIYYGSGPFTDPAQLGVMERGGPVLGIYGENDQSIPVSQVRGFELAMNARGVNNRVIVYPGVGHAFVNSETLVQPGPAQQAWQEMLSFLAENLQLNH